MKGRGRLGDCGVQVPGAQLCTGVGTPAVLTGGMNMLLVKDRRQSKE